jgi:hypothetical protein
MTRLWSFAGFIFLSLVVNAGMWSAWRVEHLRMTFTIVKSLMRLFSAFFHRGAACFLYFQVNIRSLALLVHTDEFDFFFTVFSLAIALLGLLGYLFGCRAPKRSHRESDEPLTIEIAWRVWRAHSESSFFFFLQWSQLIFSYRSIKPVRWTWINEDNDLLLFIMCLLYSMSIHELITKKHSTRSFHMSIISLSRKSRPCSSKTTVDLRCVVADVTDVHWFRTPTENFFCVLANKSLYCWNGVLVKTVSFQRSGVKYE